MISLISSALILILNFITGIIVARLLGPEQRGLLAAAVSICTMIAGITSWSIADILARHLAMQNRPRFDIFGSHMVLMLGGTITGLLSVVFLSGAGLLFLPGTGALIFGGLILIIPCMHFSQTAMGILQGTNSWVGWNFVRVSPHLAYLLALLPFIHFETPTHWIALAYGLSNVAPVILAIIIAARKETTQHRTNFQELRRTAFEALRIHSGRILQMVRQNIDRILIPLVFDPTILGYYVVAMTLATPLFSAATTLTSVYIPRITAELRSGTLQARRRTLREATSLIFGGVIFSGIYALASRPLVILLFGEDFAPGANYLPLTVIIVAGYCVTKLLEAYMIALDHTRFVLIAELLPLLSILISMALFNENFMSFLTFLALTSWVSVAIYISYFFIALRPSIFDINNKN
ncbi:oligosaccharide flippase family protein [Salipiger manganoxidans]|uniref:lipopolysaccharide biosynthesis protein n=1 Tax=Salipiger marinus TaxID=555512 RepID=UPI001E2CE2FA|nr:oligosaccharide flippase family protein [Salipiger manganoxidans]MCD1620899.1 oligosaccharide flippase family protein [Salipiger manganoxidans]